MTSPAAFHLMRRMPGGDRSETEGVDYDLLCGLLGGGGVDELLGHGSATAAASVMLERHRAALTGPRQWLFFGDARRFPLEVLRAKLSAFQVVAEGLLARAATGAVHGGVAPSNVTAQLVAAGPDVPVRHCFTVSLREPVQTPALRPPESPSGSPGDAGLGPYRCLDRAEGRADTRAEPGGAADLHGLGMLLWRTLLGNDQQGIGPIAELVGRGVRRCFGEVAFDADDWTLPVSAHHFLKGKDVQRLVDASNVLWRRSDRDAYERAVAGGGEPVDPDVWQQLLGIAFRLVAEGAGAVRGARGPAAVPDLLRLACAELGRLRARLEVGLFAAEARDAAVAEACAAASVQLRADLLGAAAPAAGPGATPPRRGCRLLVKKDGEARAREHGFLREQVTIGRRETENLLWLNDPMVSAAHAVVELQPEGFVIFDRNSTNGTEVDGIKLPGEVAQPLRDGSVIRVRPFTLTFHIGEAIGATAVVSSVSAEQLLGRLHAAFAACAAAGAAAQQQALRAVLAAAGASMGRSELLARTEEIVRRLRGGKAAGPAPGEDVGARFFVSAHKAMAQLSSALLGPGEFERPEDVARFAARLEQFALATSQWLEGMLALRPGLGRGLETAASGRSAGELRQRLLGWAGTGSGQAASGEAFARFLRDVQAMLQGLLAAGESLRAAVRDRLDPDQLVLRAGRGLRTNVAAGSALWKAYVEAFREVTAGEAFAEQFARLQQGLVDPPRGEPG